MTEDRLEGRVPWEAALVAAIGPGSAFRDSVTLEKWVTLSGTMCP